MTGANRAGPANRRRWHDVRTRSDAAAASGRMAAGPAAPPLARPPSSSAVTRDALPSQRPVPAQGRTVRRGLYRVALFAAQGGVGAVEREPRRGVVKTDRSPGLLVVADAAVGGKLAGMAVGVAIATRQRRAPVPARHMTTDAVHGQMAAAQRKGRLAVVERRGQRLPPIHLVAGGTIGGELALMTIGMAVTTGIVRQAAVPALGVAAVAGHSAVAALQRKARAAVVEGRAGFPPPADGVTPSAVAAQGRPMRIAMAVAAGAMGYRAVPPLHVAAAALHLPVGAQ